jgi:hypothetical protein
MIHEVTVEDAIPNVVQAFGHAFHSKMVSLHEYSPELYNDIKGVLNSKEL